MLIRSILSKYVRASLQNNHLKECLDRGQIPRGLKINKKLMAVDPTPDLRLDHLAILAKAEKKTMQAILAHYETAIPALREKFDHYFEKTVGLSPADRRLLVLKLLHYKNTLTATKE